MIDNSLLCHFDEIFNFIGQTYAASKSNCSLLKFWMNVIFSAMERKIILLAAACKINALGRFYLLQINVSFEFSFEITYMMSDVEKLYPCVLRT